MRFIMTKSSYDFANRYFSTFLRPINKFPIH